MDIIHYSGTKWLLEHFSVHRRLIYQWEQSMSLSTVMKRNRILHFLRHNGSWVCACIFVAAVVSFACITMHTDLLETVLVCLWASVQSKGIGSKQRFQCKCRPCFVVQLHPKRIPLISPSHLSLSEAHGGRLTEWMSFFSLGGSETRGSVLVNRNENPGVLDKKKMTINWKIPTPWKTRASTSNSAKYGSKSHWQIHCIVLGKNSVLQPRFCHFCGDFWNYWVCVNIRLHIYLQTYWTWSLY